MTNLTNEQVLANLLVQFQNAPKTKNGFVSWTHAVKLINAAADQMEGDRITNKILAGRVGKPFDRQLSKM